MESESKKNCDTSWTTEEMIQNANKWSLAGDVALLNTIKSFSKNMLSKTEELSQNINDLLYKVDEVSLKLDISQNQFHSLKNTQFIENRVYEDDETLDSKEEEKVVEKLPSEEDQEKMISESVISGLEILNKYYDMVEVSISDSDEEEESPRSFILKPKDTYAHRPLPPVIGTDEWYKRWNSEESSSDSDDNKMDDIYSESDSEDNLPKDLFKGSETSSELDFSSQTSENRPAANSTVNGSNRRPELVTSVEDNEEPEPSPVNTPLMGKSFAEQLAAKLDSVISKEEDLSGQINRERIQSANSTFGGNLFSDEPPPLTESEDKTFPKSASAGLFSGVDNLFDDVDFHSHGNRNEISTSEKGNWKLREDEPKTDNLRQDINRNTSFLPKSSKVSKGLFDSDDSSDDGIFSIGKTHLTKPAFLQPSRPVVPLFDNEPPKLEDEHKSIGDVTKKKPAGGVSIFGNSNILGNDEMRNILKNQQQNIANDLFQEVEKYIEPPEIVAAREVAKEKVTIKRKQFNLFEDETDDSSSELFKKEQISKNNLFDDDDMDNKIHAIKKPSESKSVNAEEITQDEKIHGKVETEKKAAKNVNLFDDDFRDISVPSKKSNISLFSDDDELFKDDLFSEISTKKFRSNLFDDLQNSNDLFGNKTDYVNDTVSSDDLKNENEVTTKEGISSDLNTEEVDHSFDSKVEGKSEFEDHIGVSVKEDNMNNNGTVQRSEDDSIKDEIMVPDYRKVQTNNNKLIENDDDNLFKARHGQNISGFGKEIAAPASLEEEPTPKYDSDTHSKQKEEKITVRLFDSPPPPNDDDDGDWDTKSDIFSDPDDYTPYHVNDNLQGSSLFDDEPPSLNPNESSDILKDHSDRKPSSDLFGDLQSQDSFFVTKSQVESAKMPSNLNIIQDSKTNKVHVTTSGDLEDFNYTQTEKPHTNSIFDEENILESVEQRNSKILDDGNEEHDVKNVRFEQNADILHSPIEEIENDNKIKVSQKNSTVASITDMLENELDSKAPELKVSPGKLKHSLNINVNALIPGYSPKEARELPKSQSLDSPKEEDWSFEKPQIAHTSSTSSIRKNLSGTALEKAVTFDDVDNVEVLHSVTKDRAKLPLNRRPSTRRGRQAAIRKSVIYTDSLSDNEQSKEREFEIPSNSSEILSQTLEVKENPVQEKIAEEKLAEIIKDVEKHRDVVQQNSPKASPSLSRDLSNKSKGLFESGSESDNELFNPTQKKSKKATNLKKSLFDDVSSDEDLFSSAGNSSISRKSESAAKSSQRRVQKAVPVKKLENIETSEDPLSSLFK